MSLHVSLPAPAVRGRAVQKAPAQVERPPTEYLIAVMKIERSCYEILGGDSR